MLPHGDIWPLPGQDPRKTFRTAIASHSWVLVAVEPEMRRLLSSVLCLYIVYAFLLHLNPLINLHLASVDEAFWLM